MALTGLLFIYVTAGAPVAEAFNTAIFYHAAQNSFYCCRAYIRQNITNFGFGNWR